MPAQTSSPFAVHECHQDACPGVSSRVAWTTVTHCFMVSATDYFNVFSRCRTLPLVWSQAPVIVTTSYQCCGNCTGCQFVSESRLKSRGSCISRSLVLLPRILLMTVIFSLMLVVAHWGLIPTTSGSWSCHEHTTNLATGVSRLPVLDLLPGLRRPGLSFDSFRRSLKTHLFGNWSA